MQKILESIIYILKYIFVGFIIMMIMAAIHEGGLIYDDSLTMILGYLVYVVIFMIMIKLEKKNVKKYLKFNTFNSKIIIGLIPLAVGIFFINLSLSPLLSNYSSSNNVSDKMTLTSAICVILVAPICEEIFFRGIIFNKLKLNINLFLAVFIQALVFGLFHGGGVVNAGLIGIIYAMIILWADSIWASILLHLLNNFFATLIILLGFENVINEPHYIISFLGIVIFIIAAKFLFKITHKFSNEDNTIILK